MNREPGISIDNCIVMEGYERYSSYQLTEVFAEGLYCTKEDGKYYSGYCSICEKPIPVYRCPGSDKKWKEFFWDKNSKIIEGQMPERMNGLSCELHDCFYNKVKMEFEYETGRGKNKHMIRERICICTFKIKHLKLVVCESERCRDIYVWLIRVADRSSKFNKEYKSTPNDYKIVYVLLKYLEWGIKNGGVAWTREKRDKELGMKRLQKRWTEQVQD